MKTIRLPTISFKPPATIIEAVDFFRTASKDYDDPKIPVEKRGFNFYLKTPQGAIKSQAAATEEADDFSSNDVVDATESGNGLAPIPTISASDLTIYEALKLVCDSVDYKFVIRDSVVMVMQKDMSTAEILARKYNVPEAFIERVSSASEEIKTMGGFGDSSKRASDDSGEENQERDWKVFFEQMGVKWPEGSSIKHIKSLGKLYVRNTRENLAEFEKVLDELGGQPQLIEIETRFVEVMQEDLNSLGFEWILNSDYSLNVGDKLGKALGIKKGDRVMLVLGRHYQFWYAMLGLHKLEALPELRFALAAHRVVVKEDVERVKITVVGVDAVGGKAAAETVGTVVHRLHCIGNLFAGHSVSFFGNDSCYCTSRGDSYFSF